MLSPEFAVKLGVSGSVSAGKSIMYCYAGLVVITLSFEALKGTFGLEGAAAIVGFITILLALVSLYFMEETYDKDLDYLEKTG